MSPFTRFLTTASLAALLAACSQPSAPTQGEAGTTPETSNASTASASTDTAATQAAESERLMAWFDSLFQEDLARSPLTQTALGQIDDLDAYGRWDDVSEQAAIDANERSIERLAYLRENFDPDQLSADARVSYLIYEYLQETGIRNFAFRDQTYIFTQMFGPHTGLPTTLINRHRVENIDHANAYIRRLEGLGPVLRDLIGQADARAEAGVMPPLFAFDYLIGNTANIVTGAPFDDSETDSPLLADFRSEIGDLEIDEQTREDLLIRAIAALESSVGPAYAELIAMFERHQAMTDERDGAWKLPRGEEYYQAQLATFTTLPDLSASEIHQTGLDEIARIHDEMRAIQEQVGFEGTLQDFFEFMRTDEQFYYPSTAEGRARYLAEVNAIFERVNAVVPDYFGVTPRGAMEVREVEAFRAAGSPSAFYNTGSIDGTRPGIYYANTLNMRNLPVYQMETLAYHEGIPGHHFQLTLALERENSPMFQRQLYLSAFGEGDRKSVV